MTPDPLTAPATRRAAGGTWRAFGAIVASFWLATSWVAASPFTPAVRAARLASTRAQSGSASAPAISRLRARLIANFTADQEALQLFRYREHAVTDKNGRHDDRTYAVYWVRGHEIHETIALNDRALPDAERIAEHQRALQRAARAAEQPLAPAGILRFDNRDYPFAKLAEDFVYGPPRAILWRGRPTWVYAAMPNPDTSSRSNAEKLLLSSRGEIWVDAEDLHVVRISLSTFEPVHYLFGLIATIHHASLDLQLDRHVPGVWFPREADFQVQASIVFVKSLRYAQTRSYFDYQPLAASSAAAPASSRP